MKERLTFPSDGEQGLEISCNFAGVKYDEQMENQSITKIQVRPLQIEDYGQLAQSFRRVYSDGSDVFWTHEQIETLLRIFPEGQVVTVADDKIIGCALSIIVDYDLVKGDHTYAKVTGNETFSTHNPKGNILYGIEVFIHPDYRGLRLARRMYEYRKELCEKLNLPVPNTVENAVAYLEGVKAAYPDVNPLCTAFTRGYDFARLEQVVWAPGTVNYGLVPVGSADNLVNYYASDAQLEDYKLIRSLVEKGIVSRDLQNDTVAADEKLKAGTAMMEIGHLDNFIGRYSALENAKAEDPSKADWTLDFIPFNVAQGYVLQDAATTVNATGISFAYPDHIKESLTYIQAVLTDPTLHHLIRYGIEGVHYELDENGNYVNLSEDFGPCGLSTWNWRSDALSLEGGNSAGDVKRRESLDQYKACEALTCAFTFDRTSVEDEVSNFQLVVDQYLKPLQYGLVEDVEAGLQTFRDKAEEAGVSKIQEEYTRQYTEWLANNK